MIIDTDFYNSIIVTNNLSFYRLVSNKLVNLLLKNVNMLKILACLFISILARAYTH